MSTFNEADHPRGGNPGNPGQFSAKTHKEAECSLDDEFSQEYDRWASGGYNQLSPKVAAWLNKLASEPIDPSKKMVATNQSTSYEEIKRISEDPDPTKARSFTAADAKPTPTPEERNRYEQVLKDPDIPKIRGTSSSEPKLAPAEALGKLMYDRSERRTEEKELKVEANKYQAEQRKQRNVRSRLRDYFGG